MCRSLTSQQDHDLASANLSSVRLRFSLCHQTLVFRCTKRVSWQYTTSPIASRFLRMGCLLEYGRPRNFLLTWFLHFCQEISVAQTVDTSMQFVTELDVHSSAFEDVDHDALLLAWLSEFRQPRARAPCQISWHAFLTVSLQHGKLLALEKSNVAYGSVTVDRVHTPVDGPVVAVCCPFAPYTPWPSSRLRLDDSGVNGAHWTEDFAYTNLDNTSK